MGINYESIKSILIKETEYDQLYELKIKPFKNNFENSNLINKTL